MRAAASSAALSFSGMEEMVTALDQDIAQLRALNARFIHNWVTRDVASHDAITHERFVCLGSTGGYTAKPAYLRYWATGFDPKVTVYWDVRDERIDVFGDVALVRAVNKHIDIVDGREVVGMTAYTDTYIRETNANGTSRWLCVQAQLTPVAPVNWPADDTIISRYIHGVKQ